MSENIVTVDRPWRFKYEACPHCEFVGIHGAYDVWACITVLPQHGDIDVKVVGVFGEAKEIVRKQRLQGKGRRKVHKIVGRLTRSIVDGPIN